jgi:hypothetical protein
MVVTGLTKLKMGDTFSDMLNVTLATRYAILYIVSYRIASLPLALLSARSTAK